MKVLHINFQDTGGVIAVMDLHEELLRQGIQSTYLCINLKNEHPKDKRYVEHPRVYTNKLKKLWFLYIKAWFVNKKYDALNRTIPNPNEFISLPYSPYDLTLDPLYQEADIIHLHWTSRFLDWPSFFAKNKKPIVWTLHDKNPFSGVMHCATDFPKEGIALNDKIEKLKARLVKNANIHVVGPSKSYTELAQKSSVLGRFPHTTIHHGIPSKIFFPIDKSKARTKLKLESDRRIILSIATDVNRKLKGFEAIINLAKENPSLYFVLIGEKSVNIESLENIRWTGVINDRSVLNLYYNASDLVLSNSKEESFGLTIAEGLMTGTKCESNLTGFVPEMNIQKNDPEKLLSVSCIINPEENTRDIFDLSKNTKAYIEIYKGMLKQ